MLREPGGSLKTGISRRLVDVIAEENDEVEIPLDAAVAGLGQSPELVPAVVIAADEILARAHRETDRLRRGGRRGRLGPAHPRRELFAVLLVDEAIVIMRARLKPGDLHLDAVVVQRGGRKVGLSGHKNGEDRVQPDFDGELAVGRRIIFVEDPGPEDDAVRPRDRRWRSTAERTARCPPGRSGGGCSMSSLEQASSVPAVTTMAFKKWRREIFMRKSSFRAESYSQPLPTWEATSRSASISSAGALRSR